LINNEWFCFDIPLVLDSVLDEKNLKTTLGVQSAIARVAMVDSKCSVLNAELVKVFCMLASCNKTSLLQKMKDLAPACQNGKHRRQLSPTSKISKDGHISYAHSPTCRNSGHIQFPSMTNRDNQMPPMGTNAGNTSAQAFDERRILATQCKDTVLPKRVKSSEMRKTIQKKKRWSRGKAIQCIRTRREPQEGEVDYYSTIS